MEYRQCKACRQPFRPRPQNPDQCFCSAAACQRERRRRWQAAKRQNDPDYRDNQKRAQKAGQSATPTIGGHIETSIRNTSRAIVPGSGNAHSAGLGLQRWTRQRRK